MLYGKQSSVTSLSLCKRTGSALASESIILDGQKLSGWDHYGEWTTTGLDGWWSSPEPKGENVAREGADGDFDLPINYEARYITLTGSLRAKSHEMQHQATNRFTALVQKKSRLQVVGHGAAQWADVVRASGFKMEPITDTYSRWQLRLKAPDPRKYGESNVFTGSIYQDVALWHRGNYPAFPEVTVTAGSAGLPAGILLAGPGGKTFRLTRNIPAGDSFTVNMAEGFARFYGGTPVTGGYGQMDTWTVPPGGESMIRLGADGSGTIRVTVKDTYI